MKREYEGCFIPIKWKVSQEDSIILNICEPNLGTQTLINKSIPIIKGEDLHQYINSRWFCIPLCAIEKRFEKAYQETTELIDTMHIKDLIDVYKYSIQTPKNVPSIQQHMESFLK